MDTKHAIVGMATALFLGAGISMAVAAEPGAEAGITPSVVEDDAVEAMAARHGVMGTAAMDRMHAAMRDEMPADLRDDCDAMHAAMRGGTMMDDATAHGRHHQTAR